MTEELDEECFDTLEKADERLEIIEKKLAAEHNLTGSKLQIRSQLVRMHREAIIHNEDWNQEYSTWICYGELDNE